MNEGWGGVVWNTHLDLISRSYALSSSREMAALSTSICFFKLSVSWLLQRRNNYLLANRLGVASGLAVRLPSSELPSYIFCSVADLFCRISSSVSSVSWLFWIRERFCSSSSVKMVTS